MDQRTEFSKKVIGLIQTIPKGKVATYGWIAELAGKPRGSRAVGWLLHSSTRAYHLPWQRVLKSGGKLPFPESTRSFSLQKKILESEGVVLTQGRVDLEKYLWHPKPRRRSRPGAGQDK